MQNSEVTDKLNAAETEAAELKNKIEDFEYNLDAATTKVDKFDRHLADAYLKIKTFEEGDITVQGGGEGVSKKKVGPSITSLIVCFTAGFIIKYRILY